jgi:uncharacterized protein
MRKLGLVFVALALVTTACYGSDDDAPSSDVPPGSNRGTVLIDTDGESVLMYVLVTESEEQRSHGVTNRTSLPEDEGRVFLYFEPRTGEFQMEDTPIPLSIAFFDVDGEIVEILDAEPCGDESACPTYDPGVEYMGALEVNAGAFERLGVAEGDTIEVVPGSE